MMKKALAAVLILALLTPLCALAGSGRQYIIPDSDRRLLTYDELWEWDYESIGFIFNEIFARHGYNFLPGRSYYNYFNTRPWYTPNANEDNAEACYPKLSDIEWKNERMCKDIRAYMREIGTTNPNGKNYLDYVETGEFDVLSGFRYMEFRSGQKWSVYSAPSKSSWRGANGKAVVSTNGSIYVAGWDRGWLLLMYETNNGSVRVGYASSEDIKGSFYAPQLSFANTEVACVQDAYLTDDPAMSFTQVMHINAGDKVTYLASFQNRYDWAYIETIYQGKTMRGFIRASALNLGMNIAENEEWDDSRYIK